MRILVVEDGERNIQAAKEQLGEHEVTILTGFDQAYEALSPIVDKAKCENLIRKDLPSGWKFVRMIKLYDDDHAEYVDPEGKETYDFQLPKDMYHLFWEAVNRSKYVPFDVVLTDVMIPKGGYMCMSQGGRELSEMQGEMPYGPIIALHALQNGVKRVGILTEGSHHDDPFVFAFDGLNGFVAGDIKVVCSNNMQTEKRLKDWAGLLKKLTD